MDKNDSGTLLVGDFIRIPSEESGDTDKYNLVKEINYLDGNPAFRIVEVK